MAKASDNIFPRVIYGLNTADQAAPSDSSWRVYAKANGIFARSSNSVIGPFASTSGTMTNPMTTTGDTVYSSDNSGTPTRLSIGSNGSFKHSTGTLPDWVTPPGTEIYYSEVGASVSVTATTEGTANTVLAGLSQAFDGTTTVMIEFEADVIPDASAAGRQLFVWLYEDGSSIGRLGLVQTPAAATMRVHSRLSRRMKPSNASHTYSIRASVNAGTGTVVSGSGGTGAALPAFMRITKV